MLPFKLVFAAIDLKNATIKLVAGTGYPAGFLSAGFSTGTTAIADGDTTVVIDTNTTDRIEIGWQFTMGADTIVRTVTAVTPSSGVPVTQVTFTPAVATAQLAEWADGKAMTFKAQELEVKVGEGNLTYTEAVARTYVLDRGRLDTIKDGDETPVDVSLDFTWEFLRSATSAVVPTVEEFLKQIGPAANYASSSSDPCEPYCVDIVIVNEPSCGTTTETITLAEFRYESLDHDLSAAQVSISGKCNVTQATVVRSG